MFLVQNLMQYNRDFRAGQTQPGKKYMFNPHPEYFNGLPNTQRNQNNNIENNCKTENKIIIYVKKTVQLIVQTIHRELKKNLRLPSKPN